MRTQGERANFKVRIEPRGVLNKVKIDRVRVEEQTFYPDVGYGIHRQKLSLHLKRAWWAPEELQPSAKHQGCEIELIQITPFSWQTGLLHFFTTAPQALNINASGTPEEQKQVCGLGKAALDVWILW